VEIPREQIGAVVNLLQVGTWLEEDLDRALRAEAGLSHAEYEAMMQLLQHGSRLPMGELADLSLFSQSGITRVVDRLERRGLVRREVPPENRRVTYAALTEEGIARLQEVGMPLARRVMAERFGRHLSEEDVTSLRRILTRVLRGNGWWDERQVHHRIPADEEEVARVRPDHRGPPLGDRLTAGSRNST
jgi:DNA-binding MarR family transcriptional regulator